MTAKLLAFLRAAFAGIGAVGVIGIALGFLFFAGEMRTAAGGLCASGKIGRVARAGCILAGFEERRENGTQMGAETPASRKADDLEIPTAPDRPANTPPKVVAKTPRPKDVPKLERDYRVDLDFDGLYAKELPEISTSGEPVQAERAALLKEEEFSTRGRARARVAALLLADGSTDLRMAPPDRWEWLHEVRYRAALDVDSSLRPTGEGEFAVDWTPVRLGPFYPTLGTHLDRIVTPTDRFFATSLQLGLELHCNGLWRCKP